MSTVTFLHKQQLAYVETPKIASTTMTEVMHYFSGATTVSGRIVPRKLERTRDFAHKLADLGVEKVALPNSELVNLKIKYPNYFWFCISRDPSTRIISSYFSKIQRYAKRYDKRTYLAAKIDQLKGGLSAIKDSRISANYAANRISFDEFLRGLVEHGISFDPHFDLQSSITQKSKIRYDFVMKIENLQQDFNRLCTSVELSNPFADGLSRRNETPPGSRNSINLTSENGAVINLLYKEDFELFEYSKIG